LVILSFQVDFNQLVWLAFGAGLILDLNSGRNFGFNTIFLLLVGTMIKLVIKHTELLNKLTYSLIIVAIATVFYHLIQVASLLKVLSWVDLWPLLSSLFKELAGNLILTLLIYWWVEFIFNKIEQFNKNRGVG